MLDRPLDGFVVGVTADRRWEEQAELLRNRGAEVVHGPVLRTLPLGPEAGLRAATEYLLASPPDVVVANTGIGVRGWLSAADSWGLGGELLEVLRAARIVARGPKAAGALVTVGCVVDWRSRSGRLSDVTEHLTTTSLAGARVALQLDGGGGDEAARALRAAGAEVVLLPVYRWERPIDDASAVRLADAVCTGAVDAVTFTSAPAIARLFDIAGERDLIGAFAEDVLPMCIGPVCLDAARAHGLATAVMPSRAVLGSMVNELTDVLVARRRVARTPAGELFLQGTGVVVGGVRIELTDRERGVLRALVRRPGAVVAKQALLREVWGDVDADPHALEVTVGRLRRRLGTAGRSVKTVVRRGYQLATTDDIS